MLFAHITQEANSLEDELSDGDDDDEVEEEQKPKMPSKAEKTKKKKKRSAFIDDAAEEDEDARKLKRSRFIDDIAEVDDDEDEDDDDEGGMDDLIADEGEAPDAADLAEVRRAIREAEIKAAKEDEINPEELQKYLQERFGRDRVAAYQASERGVEGATAVSQQALMPTLRDPKLWVVRTSDGTEREVVIRLLQKCYDYANKGRPLLIKSVFCKDELKGYLYVEAYKEAHVREALHGLRGVFASKAPRLVPLNEMVSALTVARSTARAVKPGAWVRPKTGVYKDDLGKVVAVDINAGRVTIRLVPRLDLAAMSQRKAEGRRGFEKAPKLRPAQRAFNPDEARSFSHLDVAHQRDRMTGELMHILNNSQRFSHGYLIKTVALKSVVLEDRLPALDELQRFNAAELDVGDGTGNDGARGAGGGRADISSLVQDLGVEDAAALEAATNARFVKGDRVQVREGDLQGILGRVELVTEDGQIMVLPTDEALADFKDAIGFAPSELSKWFDSGDHVRVEHGSHAGETGMVVALQNGVCVVLTDASKEEIKVFARDLVAAVAAPTSADRIGDYELFDLVVLDSQTVGVIVGIESETCKVLTNAGEMGKGDTRICRLPDLKRKMNNRRATAQDGARNEVSVNDIVSVEEGPLRGRSGTVKHIMRGFLFIQSRDIHEHGGYACVLGRSCHVRGGKNRSNQMSSLGGIMATPGNILATPGYNAGGVPASPAYNTSSAPPPITSGGYAGRLATQQDRVLEGKRVRMKKGPYHGQTGIIKSANATHVRVELEANMRTVTVSRGDLPAELGGQAAPRAPMGMGFGAMRTGMGMGIMAQHSFPGGRTPMHWSQEGGVAGPGGSGSGVTATPAYYSAMASATPMHPGMTPGRDAVTKTPAYDAAWAATPAHPGFGSVGGGGGGEDDERWQQSDAMRMPGFGAYGGGAGDGGEGDANKSATTVHASNGADGAAAAVAPTNAATTTTSQSTIQGPIPGSNPQYWIGLEVELPSGDHAVVRSIGNDGAAAVQGGEHGGDGKWSGFSNGSMQSCKMSDMKLVAVHPTDRVRVFMGEHEGREAEVSVMDVGRGEAFLKVPSGQMVILPMGNYAKLAVD